MKCAGQPDKVKEKVQAPGSDPYPFRVSENDTAINVLSIDGGGIRGIIPAQILYRIETEFGVDVRDYFQVYAGTSAGSMIIGAIVYGDATATDLLEKMFPDNNAKKLMGKSMLDKVMNVVQCRPKYSGKFKHRLISGIVGSKKVTDTDKNVIIPCYNISTGKTEFFQSWNPIFRKTDVADVIDASSAAPTYFPSVKIRNQYYMDGGVFANNPTDSAYAESLLGNTHDKKIRILSIGTGYTDHGQNASAGNTVKWGGIQWFFSGNILSVIMSGSEQMVNYRTRMFTKAHNDEYIRINCPVVNMTMDDTSSYNLRELRIIGDKMFEDNYKELEKFFLGENRTCARCMKCGKIREGSACGDESMYVQVSVV